jgi:hypothetical protein
MSLVQWVGTMQSEELELRAPLPTLASLDAEFGGTSKQVAREQEHQPGRQRRRYVWFLLGSAVLGVASAVIWSNTNLQSWPVAQPFPTSLTEQTESRSSAGSADQLIEFETLRNEIAELRDLQQQMSAEATALQASHRELQGSLLRAASWYSEPNVLLHQQIAAVPKPRTVGLRNQKASAQPRAETQEGNAERRNTGVTFPLVRSQTTTTEVVPIR